MATSILNIVTINESDIKRSRSITDPTTRSRSSSNESCLGKTKRDSTDGEDDATSISPNEIMFNTNGLNQQTLLTNLDDFANDLSFCLPIELVDDDSFKLFDKIQKKCCDDSRCSHSLKNILLSKKVVKSTKLKKNAKTNVKNPKKYVSKKLSASSSYQKEIKIEKDVIIKTESDDCVTSNETSVKETSSEGSISTIADTDWLAISKTSGEDDNDNQDDNVTSKRRRLSLVVPNPRKPRIAEYNCYSCSEVYEMTVVDNPWWSVYVHKCPHCNKLQVPRIDISTEKNSIDNDPNIIALYGEGMDENIDDDDEQSRDDDDGFVENSVSDEVTKDAHPFDDDGYLQVDVASKLLLLMCHARTCGGSHQNRTHSQVCLSTKYLMLHIRDCNGIDVHGRECKFSWCLPCKAMLRHLTNCYNPDSCKVCNPPELPESYLQLKTLNENTRSKHKDALSSN